MLAKMAYINKIKQDMIIKSSVLNSAHQTPCPPTGLSKQLQRNSCIENWYWRKFFYFALQVTATDADDGKNGKVAYSLQLGNIGNVFAIDSSSGYLKCVGNIDREVASRYILHIAATDGKAYWIFFKFLSSAKALSKLLLIMWKNLPQININSILKISVPHCPHCRYCHYYHSLRLWLREINRENKENSIPTICIW